MKTMNKTISLLLAMIILLSLAGLPAFATEGENQVEKITNANTDTAPINAQVTVTENGDNTSVQVGSGQSAQLTNTEAVNIGGYNISFAPAAVAQGNKPAAPDTVTINTDINSTSDGLEVSATQDSIKVAVTGAITAGNAVDDAAVDVSISNGGRAIVTVGNDAIMVDASSHGIIVDNNSKNQAVSVYAKENINSESYDDPYIGNNNKGNDGINVRNTNGKTVKIQVDGDVETGNNSTHDGIHIQGYTSNVDVTVNGDVEASKFGVVTDILYGQDPNSSKNTVTVKGNVESGQTGIFAQGNNTVTVNKKANGDGGNVKSGTLEGDRGDTAGVFAKDSSTVIVEGNVKAENGSRGVFAGGSSTVEVGGYVKSTDGDGINATGDGVTVTVNGGVSVEGAKGSGILTSNASKTTINVAGDVKSETLDGICLDNGTKGTTVTVNGNVSGGRNGLSFSNSAKGNEVIITGNVSGQAGIDAREENIIVVKKNDDGEGGNVTGSDTSSASAVIVASQNSTVIAEGDVSGEQTAQPEASIYVNISPTDIEKKAQSTIVVEGTLKETGDNSHVIKLNVPGDADVDTIKKALPNIIVQSISTDADYVVCTDNSVNADSQRTNAVADAMLESIQYIVKTKALDNKTGQDSSVTVSLVNYTTTTVNAGTANEKKTYNVATHERQLKLSVVDKTKGKIVGVSVDNDTKTNKDGNKVEYDEANDQWIITVGYGGGLNIVAKIEAFPEKNQESDNDNKKSDSKTEENKTQEGTAAYNNGNALMNFDYKNHILTIDMTTTSAHTFLTDTIRRFQRNGLESVVIKVANGSFTVAMDDLIQMIGTASSFTLKVSSDTLGIYVNGNDVATLVMT
ncbi:MAG: hypothetical protein IKS55_14515 [Oscillospiraceae bacterium]|nr:hypothetical protein [Oscillospiraceae bacterium]